MEELKENLLKRGEKVADKGEGFEGSQEVGAELPNKASSFEVVEPGAAEEIKRIRQELLPERIEIKDEQVSQLEDVADFLGLQTEEVFGRDRLLQILPEIDNQRLNALSELVKTAETKHELREDLRVFSENFDLSVEQMRNIVDTISSWTEDHSTRMAILGYRVMNRMWPFEPEFKKAFFQAALLHDAGKVATPKRILDKDGQLTSEEREIINRHPEDGDKLLSNLVRHEQMIADGTKHHEKWGGGGYSQRLERNQIPFVSQVVSVTDVFDAISSERPYKSGLSLEKCMQIVEGMSKPQQARDSQDNLVFDQRTGEKVMIPEHFSKLPVAYLKTMYENRELTAKQYFDAENEEAKIDKELEDASPYSKKHNIDVCERDRREVAKTFGKGLEKYRGVLSPEDVKRFINDVDLNKVDKKQAQYNVEVQRLREERDKSQEVFVDSLFLMVKSVDARYRAYHEGSEVDRLAGGQERTENVIRYALMLAQQMGMDIEEQKKVVMAAMFCDIGILGMDEEKIRSDKTLDVTAYEELKQVPKVGFDLLKKFTDNPEHPEVAKYFMGAEIGAAEAHLWANGKGGYGVKMNSDGKPSTIGQIVSIAYKYTAMRADNPYRGKGREQAEALEIMRKGVGTEFDEEVWKNWEALYARDLLRVFKERPEAVRWVKQLFKGEEPVVIFKQQDESRQRDRDRLVRYIEQIIGEKEPSKKMDICFEAATFAGGIGFASAMENFIELAEPIALARRDERILDKMDELYNYDLKKSEKEGMENIQGRLARREMRLVVGAIESIVIDFAEKGQSISQEFAQKIQDMVIPIYRKFVEDKLVEYRKHILTLDKDALKEDKWVLERGLKAIGDDVFTALIREQMKQIEQEQKMAELEYYIDLVRVATDNKSDPYNSEHLIAKAGQIFKQLSVENQGLMTVDIEQTRRAFYRRGYAVAFEQLQKEAEVGNVHIVLELEKRVQYWMEEAGEEQGLVEEVKKNFSKEKQRAYTKGIEKMTELLQVEDLGLEDIPKVERWINNICEWQKELATEQIAESELGAFRQQAWEVIRENMMSEIEAVLAEGDQPTLKRLVVAIGGYIVSADNKTLRTDELDGKMTMVRNRLFDSFRDGLNDDVKMGKADKVSFAIRYFYKFCGDDGRGELIGLTDGQREILKEIEKDAYRNGLKVRLTNIEQLGAEARVSQLEEGIRKLWVDADILKNMGEMVDEDYLKIETTEAAYHSFATKVSEAVQCKDVHTLGVVLGKLHELIRDKIVGDEKELLSAMYFAVGEVVERELSKIISEGRFEEFRKIRLAMSWSPDLWDKGLINTLAETEAECLENYIHRLSIQLRMEGKKSHLIELRELEEEIRKVAVSKKINVNGEIFEGAQREAERILGILKMAILSYERIGHLGNQSLSGAIGNWAKDIPLLEKISGGAEDVEVIKNIVGEYMTR